MNFAPKIKVETWTEFLTRRGITPDAWKALSHEQQVNLDQEWCPRKTHIDIDSLDPLNHREERYDLLHYETADDGRIVEVYDEQKQKGL